VDGGAGVVGTLFPHSLSQSEISNLLTYCRKSSSLQGLGQPETQNTNQSPCHSVSLHTFSHCITAHLVTLYHCTPSHTVSLHTFSHCITTHLLTVYHYTPSHTVSLHTFSHCITAHLLTLYHCTPSHSRRNVSSPGRFFSSIEELSVIGL